MALRRYTFRLYPNKTQERELFAARRLHGYLYNACIAHRRFEWKKNQKTVDYFQQQNCLPAFKKEWVEFAHLHSQALQSTVKRVDLAYNSFFKGLRGLPNFKSIRNYSGWTYSSKSGWKTSTNGKHGTVTLNDLGITLKMRGQAKSWCTPTTLTIVYKPRKKQWFASFTCNVSVKEAKFGSVSDLKYESIVAFDLGTATAITCFDGIKFEEISNPRFTQVAEEKVKQESKKLRRKRAPNRKKGIKASNRWKKARRRVSKLQRKVALQRADWQHKITSDIASRHDIGVTEKLNTKGLTRKAGGNAASQAAYSTPVRRAKKRCDPASSHDARERAPRQGGKRKKQKAGLNKSILSVGFSTLNQMIAYKIEAKGGLLLQLNTRRVKPSQRCPKCGIVHKNWADLSNRYHVCDNCTFEIERDKGSVLVMYNVATNQQQGCGTHLLDSGCLSSTSLTSKRKHTGSMKQLGQMKRQKSRLSAEELETPTSASAKLG
ncbi:RNA-guided endonuclease TnpB family protein [Pleurocapsa sp. PCC 7319]|uniref:RNA-guided endonuclease InsQ/TnpB family protein n=1 Tax=Pleurocapsa sp. PCC 7319 TaxID=118161 RepID=UPI000344FEA8|nr:RNA-guided endonuclease TnpB family protein [Pleurocapsa sp. PCC 7319]